MQNLELEKHTCMQPLIFGRALLQRSKGLGTGQQPAVEKVVCLKENQTLTRIFWSWCRLTI